MDWKTYVAAFNLEVDGGIFMCKIQKMVLWLCSSGSHMMLSHAFSTDMSTWSVNVKNQHDSGTIENKGLQQQSHAFCQHTTCLG